MVAQADERLQIRRRHRCRGNCTGFQLSGAASSIQPCQARSALSSMLIDAWHTEARRVAM
ncbi:hypothetical protein [Novilysobacter erysipheiresistens]|uniref:Uncharacterized protein n=1 Tax=Novilysobacter erysipheiresistens TaxID=1749332 RepID=A0ABU7Z0A5_9GAMM